MDIREKLTPVADEVVLVLNSASGRNIGTGLQMDLEESLSKVLPPEVGYKFEFNMSGETRNTFFEKANPSNFITV